VPRPDPSPLGKRHPRPTTGRTVVPGTGRPPAPAETPAPSSPRRGSARGPTACGPLRPRCDPCRRKGQRERSRNSPFAAASRSPLTDSNRRPPPYHLTPAATSRNLRQQIWLVSAVSAAGRFAANCHWLRLLGSF
jgi:hypothetical protein